MLRKYAVLNHSARVDVDTAIDEDQGQQYDKTRAKRGRGAGAWLEKRGRDLIDGHE